MVRKHGTRSPLRLLTGQALNAQMPSATMKKFDNPEKHENESESRMRQLQLRRSFVQGSEYTVQSETSTDRYSIGSSRKKRNRELEEPQWIPKELMPGRMDHARGDIHAWDDEQLATQYNFEKEIGYGNWGSCWLVTSNSTTLTVKQDKQYAVKLVHRQGTVHSNARVKALWNEFKVLRACGKPIHPNLASFREFAVTPSYALIVMDFYKNAMNVALPISVYGGRMGYFHQLCSCLAWLHEHYVTHCDIKVANLLVDASKNGPYGKPILVDFGFATLHDCKSQFWSTQTWGTPEYLSPERSRGDRHDERLSDIWAMGITMFELATGRTPFEEMDETFLTKDQLAVYYNRTLSGEWIGEYDISKELEDLCKSMLHPDTKKRIFARQVLQHPYFGIEPDASSSNEPSANVDNAQTAKGMQSNNIRLCDAVESTVLTDEVALAPNDEHDVSVTGQSSWIDESSSIIIQTPQHSEDTPTEQLQLTPAIWMENAMHERVRIVVDEVADESSLSVLRSQYAFEAQHEVGSESSSVSSAEEVVSSSPRADGEPLNDKMGKRRNVIKDDSPVKLIPKVKISSGMRRNSDSARNPAPPNISANGKRRGLVISPQQIHTEVNTECNSAKEADVRGPLTFLPVDCAGAKIGSPRVEEAVVSGVCKTQERDSLAEHQHFDGHSMDLLARLNALEELTQSLSQMITSLRCKVEASMGKPQQTMVSKTDGNHEMIERVGKAPPRLPSKELAQTFPEVPSSVPLPSEGITTSYPFVTPIHVAHHSRDADVSLRDAKFELIEIPSLLRTKGDKNVEQVPAEVFNPLTAHLKTTLGRNKASERASVTILQSEIQQKADQVAVEGAWETIADQNGDVSTNGRQSLQHSPRRSKLAKVKSLSIQRSGSFSQWLGKRYSGASTNAPRFPTWSLAIVPPESKQNVIESNTYSAKEICGERRSYAGRTSSISSRPVSEAHISTAYSGHKRQTSELLRHPQLFQSHSTLSTKRARPATSHAGTLNDCSARKGHSIGYDPLRKMSAEPIGESQGGSPSFTWDSHSQTHTSTSGGALWRMLTNRIATSVRSPRG